MAAPANVATLPEIRHLGPVADIVDMGSIMLTVPEFRGATEHEAVGEAQTAMIERYFAAASAGPAEGGSEAAVWDTVLGLQLTDLERAADDATQNAIALNILVGNALAAYGMPRGEVNGLVAQRSWRIAQTRNGGRIADAADAHIGLCVVTGNPDKPYESVAEVMHPFGDLLRVTDKNYGGNTALSSDIVRTADVEEATWLIELGVAKDDMLGVGSNLPDVSPEIRADMARDLLHRGVRIHRNLLRKDEPFCSVLPRDEVIDSALEHDPGALTGQTLEEQPQERRDAIVRAMLPKISSVNLDAWLTYTLKGDVSAELVTDIIDVVGERCTVGMFRPFDQLPDGSLQKMRAANVDDAFSTRLIGKLSDADQRVALQLAAQEEGIWRYSIYDDPSLFRVIGRQELLQRARDADQLRTVGHNIHNWTDGSDQELLLEIMDCPTISGCFAIANGAGRLPNLDKAWLLSELMERDNYMAIATGMAVFGDLVDQRQFIADRVADGATDCLQLHLQNFTQLTPGEMYDTLIDAGLFAIATANTLYFRDDRSAQSIFDDLLTRPGGPEALCKSLTFFSDLDIKPLYDHLIARDDENAEFTLASHFANFIRAGVDPTDILTRISQTQEGIERMLKAYQDVPEIAAFSSFEALLQRAFDMQFDRALLENLKLIPAAMHDRIVDLSFAVGRGYLCTTYESLQVDRRALGRRLCANGYDLSLSMRAESFYGRDLSGLGFEDLLADGAAAVAIKYRHRFADYSEARAVAQLVADEKAYVLNKNCATCKGRYRKRPLYSWLQAATDKVL